MNANTALKATARTASEVASELGPIFGERANAAIDEDVYVADNIAMLKASGLVEAGVPAELGRWRRGRRRTGRHA